jgi:hypothetical protein
MNNLTRDRQMVNTVSAPNVRKSLLIRWRTLRGLVSIIIFLVIALLLELLIVFYAIGLGVNDQSVVQYSFKFPGTGWTATVGMSLLFHLVPLVAVLALVSSWAYLAKHPAVGPREPARSTQTAKRAKHPEARSYVTRLRSELLQAPTKSAVIVLFTFIGFAFVLSLLAYPQLIYQTIAHAYENNPSLLSFIKGSGKVFSPFGSFANGAIPFIGPAFRDFAASLGGSFAFLANLDNPGKYLVFQNVAVWVSAVLALAYSELSRSGYRYKKIRTKKGS